MPRAKLDSWANLAHKVVPGNVNLPRFAFSTLAYSAGEEEAIATAELADGYDAPTVAKATLRRNQTSHIWISPTGITVGPIPTDGQLGGPSVTRWLDWLPTGALAPLNQRFGHEMPPFSASNPTYNQAQIAAGYGSNGGWTKRAESVRSFWRELTGVDFGVPVLVYRENTSGSTVWQGTRNFITANKVAGKLLLGVQEYISETSDPDFTFTNSGAGGSRMMVWQFDTQPGFQGLRALVIACTGTNPRDLAGADAVRNINGVWCTDVWRYLVDFKTTRVVTSYASLAVPTGSVIQQIGIGLEIVASTVNPDMPAGAAYTDDNGVGLATYIGRYIGGVEYAEAFSYFGAVTYDAATKTFAVADTDLAVDWLGSRLGQMALASGATQPQVDAVAGLRIRSFLARNQVKVPSTLLAKLSPVVDGDVSVEELAAEVMYPVDGVEAQVTFGEAEAKAAGQNAQVVHQVVGTAPVAPQYPTIRVLQFPFNGGGTVFRTEGYDVVSRIYVVLEKDVFLQAALSGAAIDVLVGNSGYTVATAFEAAAGMAYADVLTTQSTGDPGDDFNEAALFRGMAPNPALLTESRRAAFYLMQYGRQRTTMSTFIIAAILQGRQSYKQLIGDSV